MGAALAEEFEFVVLVALDQGRLLASEYACEMLDLEVLRKTGDEVDDKLHVLAAVEYGLRVEAVVAATAVLLSVFFAEVVEQQFPAALARLGVCHDLVQELAADFLLGHGLALHELLQFAYILIAVVGDAEAFFAVAARAPGLLIIALYALRDVVVDYETHVRLVDSHAEGDRGHYHIYLLHQELVLILGTHLRIETCVIRQRPDAVDAEEGGHLLDLLPAEAVDDAGLAGILAYETHYVLLRLNFVTDFVIKVGAVEGRLENDGILNTQILEYVALHFWSSRCGEGDDGSAAYLVHQTADAPVLRSEVVSPFRDTVRLVHSVERYLDFLQKGYVLFLCQRFGSDVEYLGASGEKVGTDLVYFLPRQRGIQEMGDTLVAADKAAQHIHLILHERNQRRNHDSRALRHKGRELIAK